MPIINETELSVTPTYTDFTGTYTGIKPELLRTELLNWLAYIRKRLTSIDFILIKPIPQNYTQVIAQAPGYDRFLELRRRDLYSIDEKYKFFSDMNMTNADYIIAQYKFLPGWIDLIENQDIPEMLGILENINTWLQTNFNLVNNVLQPVSVPVSGQITSQTVPEQPVKEPPETIYTSPDETSGTDIVNNAKEQAIKNPLLVVSIGIGLLKLFHFF